MSPFIDDRDRCRRKALTRKKSRSCILVAFFVLVPCFSIHPQTAPAYANPISAIPVPPPQAPDEATRKITGLVHAGKYAEAQKLTDGLLIAYPADQRLIKAKALIERMLSPGGATEAIPTSGQVTKPETTANANQLTGMDKVDYNALIVLARRAQQTTDLAEQTKLLSQFMDQSRSFLERRPEQILLWQLRAQIAASEDDVWAGYEAGQRLLAAGAADSNDSALQNLMGELKNKGWFEREAAVAAEKQEELTKNYGWMRGNWSESFSIPYTYRAPDGFMSSMKTHTNPGEHVYKEEFDFSKSLPVIEAYILDDSGKTKWVPTKFTLDGSGALRCELYIDQEHAYKQATSCQIDENRKTITLFVLRDGKSEAHLLTNTDNAQQGLAASLSPSAAKSTKTVGASFSPASGSNSLPLSAAPAQQLSTPLDDSNPQPSSQRTTTTRALGPLTPAPASQADPSTVNAASSQSASSAGPTTAILHLYRLSHMTGAFVQYEVEIDGRRVAKIANAESVRVDLPPGKHNINATYRSVKSDRPLYDLEMESGKEYWIRVDLSDGFIVHMRLAVVPEAEAREESGKLKEIAKGDLPGK
jgi:hypothetical protein